MIISASRRTDIPAFYSEWFMNRVRRGYCDVANPYNKRQISKISLQARDVEAIVFWSKNPQPLIKHLAELDRLGHRYYFQFTLNNYSFYFEPNVPPLSKRLDTFCELANLIGPKRVVWRYDPIIISNISDYEFHRMEFEKLAGRLTGRTNRVVISILDIYRKTARKLKHLEEKGIVVESNPTQSTQLLDLLRDLARIAHIFNIEIVSCAEDCDYSNLGICPGRCIDGDLIDKLWHTSRKWKKDPGQRDSCGCVISRDIGMSDTCLHSCVYCYSTISEKMAILNHQRHDTSCSLLVGNDRDLDKTVESVQRTLF